jgi:fatty-acyl-CoA synthase
MHSMASIPLPGYRARRGLGYRRRDMLLASLFDPARLGPLRTAADSVVSGAARALSSAERALSSAETIARVGKKLGLHRTLRADTLRLLLEEAARGRLNPSFIYRFWAVAAPDRPALVQATLPAVKGATEPAAGISGPPLRTYTYRQLNEAIDRVGLALTRRGIGRGSAVLLLLKNRVEFIVIQAALSRIGARAVPASWRSTVPEIAYLARHSGAKAAFFDVDLAEVIHEAAPALDGIPRAELFSVGGAAPGFTSLDELTEGVCGAAPDRSAEGAMVMYTSGTTGKPKGAVRTFDDRDAMPAALGFVGLTPFRVGEPHLVACPIYHTTAFGFATFAFLLGNTVVMLADFKPEVFLDVVERYRIATTAVVPTMLHRLVELGEAGLRGRDLASLTAIFSGGAPLDGSLAIAALDLLDDKVWNFYGATETGIVTLANPLDLRASPGTIGRAVPGVALRLVDERGKDCEVGEVGELFARTGLQVKGYHDDPEATRGLMRGGYFSVGDLARADKHGCYFIEGRKRDMIISGGVNVYPAEVEAVLHEHPAVSEAAVVGAPDRVWGERVRAFVVRRPGVSLDEEALRAHCRERLAGPKVPKEYVFLDALPHNPTGKVLKRELRAPGDA